MSNDCIFCKIIDGVIPSTTIYEDDEFKAFLDISPANKGHVILIPKKHVANIYEAGEEITSKIFTVAAKIAKAVKKELGCDGVNVLQNNEEAAGQTVFHLHVHIIPRYEGDGKLVNWSTTSYAEGEAQELADRLKAAL